MIKKCYKCFRPIKTCYCKWLKPIDSEVKFVFLIHPKEAFKQKTGTGRLAHLTLTGSDLIVGVDFTSDPIVNALINDPLFYSVVLYPGINSFTAGSKELIQGRYSKKLCIFIIDATWSLAKKMLRLSANLQTLPTISFENNYKSKFLIKLQPRSFCLSTIESVFYLIKELQDSGVVKDHVNPDGLMEVFQKMIDFQLSCAQDPDRMSYRKASLSGGPKRAILKNKRNIIFRAT